MTLPGWYRLALLIVALVAAPASPAAPEYIIKFATLAPPGSTWMNLLQDWDSELRPRAMAESASNSTRAAYRATNRRC